MTYFSKFQNIDYDFSTTNKPNVLPVADLMTRVVMNVDGPRTTRIMFDPYMIQDRDKPEVISYLLYGTPYYHWTILHVNNITNMQTDWPMDAVNFNEYMLKKYADEDMYATKEYRASNGIYGDYDWLATYYNETPIPVTYYDWETEMNERKRQIIVVSPSFIDTYVTRFMSKLA